MIYNVDQNKCLSSSIMEDKAYRIVRSRVVHQDSYRNRRVQERKLTEANMISWITELNISRVHFRMSYQDKRRNNRIGDRLFLMTQMKSSMLRVLVHRLTPSNKKNMRVKPKKTMSTQVIAFKDYHFRRTICSFKTLRR